MATAEELLATVGNEQNYIVIDSDLRTMTFPASVKNIGVENDKDVHKLSFMMPRYFSEYDLSTFNIRINYLNAQGDGDMYVVTEPTVEDDAIYFSWLVGRHACLYRGAVTFIVCLKLADGEGDVAQEFNTTLASLQVLPGLETEPTILETDYDIIEQLLLTIQDTNDKIKAVLDSGMTAEELGNIAEEQKTLKARMDTFTSLPDGSTAGDAELTDIRVGADGVTYNTAGEAVRTQINDVKSEINMSNNGYEGIKGTFVHGSANGATGEMTESANNYKYRVVTPTAIEYDRDVTIRCADGYGFQVFWYDENDAFVSRTGSANLKEFAIKANTKFRLFVNLDPIDASANVDPSVFKSNIYVESVVGYDILNLKAETANTEIKIDASNDGKEFLKTTFVHGSVNTSTGAMTESVNSYKYQTVQLNAISYDRDVLITCNDGYQFQAYWYDENDNYVSRMANIAYEYLMPANRRFRIYMRLDPHDTSANVDPSVFLANIFVSSVVGKSIIDITENPLSTLPNYLVNTLSYKPLGQLSKGYILLSCDDGTEGLATYTIPMLIEKGVPATFGLLKTSPVITDETYLATLVDAITNHGCCVAQHGSAQWPTYTEAALNAYFDETAALLEAAGITEIYGAICPGGASDDTSPLVQAVAGGRFGAVFSGGTHGEITYGNNNASGPRTNMYAMNRKSAIGFADAAAYQAAIDDAYENHYILCPFWHDYTIVDNASYKAIIEGMIDYAKAKGLTFITMKDLPSII